MLRARTVSRSPRYSAWVIKLSGGQRQRLSIACALVGNPDLLFLDEPTTGLDPQARRQLWEIIREFRDQGRTVLLTTHYMDEAERLCDRVAIVNQGKVIALGTPNELILSLGGDHMIELTLAGESSIETALENLSNISSVISLRRDSDRLLLSATEPHVALPALLQRLQAHQIELAGLTTRHASLEDVFVNLTGRHLSDDQGSG